MCTTTPDPMKALHFGLIKPRWVLSLHVFFALSTRQLCLRIMKLTTWQKVEGISVLCAFRVLDNNGVSRIVSSRTPCADIRFCRKDVDELAFAFVTPLGAESTDEH